MIIGVIGPGEADEAARAAAYRTGQAVAEHGATLVCGGLGGVMLEACRGAKRGGTLTVGILPGDDPRDANEFVDVPVVTGLGHARNTIVARTADALVAIAGAHGTLSEIAFALVVGTPVVGLGTWEVRDGRGVEPDILRAETPEDAVSAAVALAVGRGRDRRGGSKS